LLCVGGEARGNHGGDTYGDGKACKGEAAGIERRRSAGLGKVYQPAHTAAEVRARADGADGEARSTNPQLVLGLLGQRASERLGIAGAVDSGFIARDFAFLVDATADPVEGRAPPQQAKHDTLRERRQHVVAANVGVLMLEQRRHAGRAEGDRFRQDD
jgi:hypothetical protein